MKVALGADHAGVEMKNQLLAVVAALGHEPVDYGGDGSDKAFASQAKFSLADLYAASGRRPEAEKILRDLMNHPTVMVSKEQAQIELARVLAPSNPGEARKLLEPLRTQSGGVGRVALTALGEISANR